MREGGGGRGQYDFSKCEEKGEWGCKHEEIRVGLTIAVVIVSLTLAANLFPLVWKRHQRREGLMMLRGFCYVWKVPQIYNGGESQFWSGLLSFLGLRWRHHYFLCKIVLFDVIRCHITLRRCSPALNGIEGGERHGWRTGRRRLRLLYLLQRCHLRIEVRVDRVKGESLSRLKHEHEYVGNKRYKMDEQRDGHGKQKPKEGLIDWPPVFPQAGPHSKPDSQRFTLNVEKVRCE